MGRDVVIVDAVNQRLKIGNRTIPVAATVDDVAVSRGGKIALLDRLGARTVQLVGGEPIKLEGPGIPDAGGITGVFFDQAGNLFVEREHATLLKMADERGQPVAQRTEAPGRPLRDGSGFVRAAVLDRGQGIVGVTALDVAGKVRWSATIDVGDRVLYIALLDSDARGNVFVGAHVGREAKEKPYRIVDEKLVLRKLDAGGRVVGELALDAPPPAEEAFRDLAVSDEGVIYWMQRGPDGVRVETITL